MAMDKFYIKKQEFSNRTFRFPIDMLDELSKLASEKNISLNQVVLQCCEYALNNLSEEEPEK